MANELARLDGGVMVRDEWTDDRKNLIRRMYCRGADDVQFDVFVETCRRTGLSPLMKQIYCVLRQSKGEQVMTIQVGIDGFRLIADKTGCYVPGRETTYTYDEKGNVATATAYVKKLVAGEWHEIGATVRWDEFHGDSSFWRDMPHHQLGKVSEAHALRRAFPADLSGLYTTDEMEQADRTPGASKTSDVNRFTPRVSEKAPAALPATAIQPSPRPATPKPASEPSERDKAKLEYGKAAFRAQQAGVKPPSISREATAEEIHAAVLVLEAEILDAESERAQGAAEGAS
jgi:phage recombination protein Bet